MLLTIWPPAEKEVQASIEPSYSVVTYHYANRISDYFERNKCQPSAPCGNREFVLVFTAEVVKWLRFFNVHESAHPKYLANVVAENWYSTNISSAGCIGRTQVCSIKRADYLLKKRGVDTSRLSVNQLDAARGVAIYWDKLQISKGEPWLAVKFYNGRDTVKNKNAATKHKNKVWRMHQQIFMEGA